MSEGPAWIGRKAASALDPAQVETALERMAESWPAAASPLLDVIENFPLGEAALLHLISVSSICAARFVRHPELLLWLAQPEVCSAPRGRHDMLARHSRAISKRSDFGKVAKCCGLRCGK
jgi:hypothetical protein